MIFYDQKLSFSIAAIHVNDSNGAIAHSLSTSTIRYGIRERSKAKNKYNYSYMDDLWMKHLATNEMKN